MNQAWTRDPLRFKYRSPRVAAKNAAVAPNNEKCIPILLPISPTKTPLNNLKPEDDMPNKPNTFPRIASGAFICTIVWFMLLNDNSQNPAMNRHTRASG